MITFKGHSFYLFFLLKKETCYNIIIIVIIYTQLKLLLRTRSTLFESVNAPQHLHVSLSWTIFKKFCFFYLPEYSSLNKEHTKESHQVKILEIQCPICGFLLCLKYSERPV